MNEMVTITREEYVRLCEAAEELSDLRAYDRAVAAGGESMPAAFVKRLVQGESPVTVWREYRGLTGAELARRAEVNRIQLHDIETGKKQGSISTVKKIADALGVYLDELV